MSQPTDFDIPSGPPAARTLVASRINAAFAAILTSHSGSARPGYADTGTVWLDSDTGQLKLYDGASDLDIAVNAGTPASAAAAGFVGEIAWDADFIYVCTATDTWKRVAIATWP
jgi:murein DD-endopeptidase MepM/ murein hydrolase activator NlpD